MQYIADNVDHNVATIDGTGTFHGMGIIAAVTPGTQTNKPVHKVQMMLKRFLLLAASTFNTSRFLQQPSPGRSQCRAIKRDRRQDSQVYGWTICGRLHLPES
jgi:hypothetical protein